MILISHLGRPEGKKDLRYSLEPVAEKLKELLKLKAQNLKLKAKINSFDAFQIAPNLILLENIRFYPGEEKNSPQFAHKLANLGDIFVMDAFGAAHRAHASTFGVAQILPSVSGLLLASEVHALSRALEKPERPLVAIMGGAKLDDKIEVIFNLISKVDSLILAGGIANTFLQAEGYQAGDSITSNKFIPLIKNLLKKERKKIILPIDAVIANKLDGKANIKIVTLGNKSAIICKPPWSIVDIGKKTIKLFSDIIKEAETIIWNGPLGVYEIRKFAKGTHDVGKVVDEVSKGKPYGLVGGGDVITALEKMKIISDIDYVSTGGGAMLKYLAGKKLPGIEILRSKKLKVKS